MDHPFLLATPRPPKALVHSAGITSLQEVQVAAVGEAIHLMFDAQR